jgi:hypothetical protein
VSDKAPQRYSFYLCTGWAQLHALYSRCRSVPITAASMIIISFPTALVKPSLPGWNAITSGRSTDTGSNLETIAALAQRQSSLMVFLLVLFPTVSDAHRKVRFRPEAPPTRSMQSYHARNPLPSPQEARVFCYPPSVSSTLTVQPSHRWRDRQHRPSSPSCPADV